MEILRRVPAEVDPAAAAVGGASAAAALEPQRPRHAERRRRCRLSLNGQVVEATPTGFGPTIEAVAAAHTVAGLAGLADSPLADSPLRNADDIRGQIGVVERGSVSFVEKGVPLVVSSRNQCCWRIGGAMLCSQSAEWGLQALPLRVRPWGSTRPVRQV